MVISRLFKTSIRSEVVGEEGSLQSRKGKFVRIVDLSRLALNLLHGNCFRHFVGLVW